LAAAATNGSGQVERENETTGRVAGRFQKAPGYAAGELRL